MAIFRSPSPFLQPLKFGHDRRRTSINPFLWRLMNRKGEHFSPSRTFTLPHAIKLTDRYVGCAPTDSLRHGSIYISYSPLFHPKSLISLHGLLWCLCGQACCICSALSLIGILAILGIQLQWEARFWFVSHNWLATSVLSGGFIVWRLWLASSIYWPAQTNQLSSHGTLLGRRLFTFPADAPLWSFSFVLKDALITPS